MTKRHYEIYPRMTAKRREYLRSMADLGRRSRPQGRVGYECAVLRWTCWCYRDKTRGDFIDDAEARRRYGDSCAAYWPHVEKAGEMITPLGRQALAML